MARVVVVSETDPVKTFLDEKVNVVHIEDQQPAEQFLQRLAWAIYDDADMPDAQRYAADRPLAGHV